LLKAYIRSAHERHTWCVGQAGFGAGMSVGFGTVQFCLRLPCSGLNSDIFNKQGWSVDVAWATLVRRICVQGGTPCRRRPAFMCWFVTFQQSMRQTSC